MTRSGPTGFTLNRRQAVGVGLLGALLGIGLLGPLVCPPPALDLVNDLASPAVVGGLGRGEGGVDVVAALIYGARGALVVGLAVATFATVIAVLLALVAALGSPTQQRLVDRAVDVTLAFPSLLLAAALSALLAPSLLGVVVVLTVSSWAGPTRFLAGGMAAVVVRDHVQSARALGASTLRVAVVHVLPLVAPAIFIQLSQIFAGAIVAEAGLAFLGLTALPLTPPLYASWGGLLDDGVAVLFAAPHLWWPPALALLLVSTAAQLVSPET